MNPELFEQGLQTRREVLGAAYADAALAQAATSMKLDFGLAITSLRQGQRADACGRCVTLAQRGQADPARVVAP